MALPLGKNRDTQTCIRNEHTQANFAVCCSFYIWYLLNKFALPISFWGPIPFFPSPHLSFSGTGKAIPVSLRYLSPLKSNCMHHYYIDASVCRPSKFKKHVYTTIMSWSSVFPKLLILWCFLVRKDPTNQNKQDPATARTATHSTISTTRTEHQEQTLLATLKPAKILPTSK